MIFIEYSAFLEEETSFQQYAQICKYFENKEIACFEKAKYNYGSRFRVKSDGIGHTRYLAEQHSREALRQIQQLQPSVERDALITATQRVINRLK